MDRVTPDWVERQLDDLTYPVTRAHAATALADTVVEVEGTERNLGRLVSQAGSDAFHGPEHVAEDLNAVLDDELDDSLGADA
ncbi:MAG: hypothetical protein ABEJ43_01160 [Haloferacaceae archaeon]